MKLPGRGSTAVREPEPDAEPVHRSGSQPDQGLEAHGEAVAREDAVRDELDVPDAPAEVVEPPTLAKPPESPWSDGFGRTAIRSAQTLFVVALTALIVYAAVQLRLVIIPVLIAVLIAAALAPVVGRLSTRGLSRGLATLVTLLIGVVLLGLVVWAVVAGVVGQLPQLQQSVTDGVAQLQQFVTQGPVPVTDEQIESARTGAIGVLTGDSFRSGALAGASLVGQVITGLLLAIVVLIYLLKDGPSIYAFLISGTDGNRHTRLVHVGERSVGVLGGYIRGTTIVALADAVLIGGGLIILGVPLALPLALVTFVAAYIPIVGAVIAGLIAALVTLVTNGPVDALIVVVIVILVNQVEGNLLSPLVLGKALSLHPLAILLALTAGTIVAGVIGALLSVPIAAVGWAAVKSWNEDKRTTNAALTHDQPDAPAPPRVAASRA